MHMPPIEVLN